MSPLSCTGGSRLAPVQTSGSARPLQACVAARLPCAAVLPKFPMFEGLKRGGQHRNRLPRVYGRGRRRDPVIAPGIQISQNDMVDLYNYLLRNRIIYVGSRITDEVATNIVASLLALEMADDSADIRMYINSGGGSAYAITGVLDTMRAVKPDISTIALGQCISTSTLLLAGGTKGKRFAMPNARIMMHQPAGGAMGSFTDVKLQASELNRTLKVVHAFYQKFTGLPLDTIQEETDRDNFMSPARAKELGLIDDVVDASSALPALAAKEAALAWQR
eukprot:jgi/Botrbrau1/22983/Bobra.0030s0049.1